MRLLARIALPLALAGFLAATLLPFDSAHPLSESRAVRGADGAWRLDTPSLFCTDAMPPFLEGPAFREGRFTVELAVQVEAFNPHDTVRLVTYSQNDVSWSLNWAVGFSGRNLVVRHRGSSPRCHDAIVPHTVQHFVVAYGGGAATLYRDGAFHQRREHAPPQPWAEGSHLVLGNELTGDRPFVGAFHLLRLYDRTLTADEAARLATAFRGRHPAPSPPGAAVLALRPTADGAFELAGAGAPTIPVRRVPWPFAHKFRQFLTMPRGLQEFEPGDVVRNVLGTVPLGLLAVFALGLPLWAIALAQALLSLLVEICQIFTYTHRFADLTDLAANVAGAVLGALFARWLHARLGRHGGELPA